MYWEIPHARPVDLPDHVVAGKKARKGKTYTFIVEEDTLKHCVPGMKFDATMKQLENGIIWIDSVDVVFPSFYTWTLNERVRALREPGPPKAWMERANRKRNNEPEPEPEESEEAANGPNDEDATKAVEAGEAINDEQAGETTQSAAAQDITAGSALHSTFLVRVD